MKYLIIKLSVLKESFQKKGKDTYFIPHEGGWAPATLTGRFGMGAEGRW
jgi:hypothetical protein